MRDHTPLLPMTVEIVEHASKPGANPSTMLPVAVIAAERERLETCVREPIRRPGSIQPHGVLLTVARTSWTIMQASRNTDVLLGVSAEDLLGTAVAGLIGGGAVERLSAVGHPLSRRR